MLYSMPGFIILGFFLLFQVSLVHSYNMSLIMHNYPTPFTPNNRVMGFILAFNLYHIDPVVLIVNEYLSMCEAGWDPTIIFFTTVSWSPSMFRYFRQRSYCYRKGSSINILTSVHNRTIGTALAAEHRKYLGKVVNDYDVFIYHEDDLLFKANHLAAYLYETKKLHQLQPEGKQTLLWDHVIGFQRYRRIQRGNDINANFGEQDVFEQELLEEMPDFGMTCMENSAPYLRVTGNTHQGMYIFIQQQVHMLQEKCSFLNQSSPSREYMSSFSVYDKKRNHCAMTKLLPPDKLVTFGILHYYQQRHISWTSLFLADENLRAGYHFAAMPRSSGGTVPSCWKEIVNVSSSEQREHQAVPKL